MSKLIIFSASTDTEHIVRNASNYSTWGDLVSGEGIESMVSNQKAVVKGSGAVLTNSSPVPSGEATVFLNVAKIKAGSNSDALSVTAEFIEKLRTI